MALAKERHKAVNFGNDLLSAVNGPIADRRRQGFSLWDSYCFELNNHDHRDYISTWEAWQPRKNSTPYFKISDDKYLFACVFGPHITVPPTYALIEKGELLDVDVRGGDIYDRLRERGGVFLKDRFGSEGFNVVELRAQSDGLYHRDKLLTREDLSDIIRGFPHGIIQGRLAQGQFENGIFAESINTIRVISMRRRDGVEHEVVGAMHRFGTKKSAPVDNFRQGGACARVDIETGRLGKLAAMFDTDREGRHIFRAQHPDTGAQVEGAVIPNWEKLKGLVAELTRKLPFFEYTAWDFAAQDDGFALIEINMKSGLGFFQVHGGARHTPLGEKYREHGYLVEPWG